MRPALCNRNLTHVRFHSQPLIDTYEVKIKMYLMDPRLLQSAVWFMQSAINFCQVEETLNPGQSPTRPSVNKIHALISNFRFRWNVRFEFPMPTGQCWPLLLDHFPVMFNGCTTFVGRPTTATQNWQCCADAGIKSRYRLYTWKKISNTKQRNNLNYKLSIYQYLQYSTKTLQNWTEKTLTLTPSLAKALGYFLFSSSNS